MRVREHDTRIPVQFHHLLGSKTGTVNSVKRRLFERDGPDVAVTRPTTGDLDVLFTGEQGRGIEMEVAGKGQDLDEGLTSGVGEVVERYCSLWSPAGDAVTLASHAELAADPDATVVDFEYLDVVESVTGDDLEPVTPAAELPWTTATNLFTGEAVHVPATAVWLGGEFDVAESLHYLATTNGFAAGQSLADALAGAVVELVERDGFMRTWLRRDPPRRLRLPDEHPGAEFVRDHLAGTAERVELVACDGRVDLPVAGTVLRSRDPAEPSFVVAAGAALDWTPAIVDSLVEAVQTLPFTRTAAAVRDPDSLDPEDVTGLDDNVRYYTVEDNVDAVAFFLEGDATTVDPAGDAGPAEATARLRTCLEALAAADCTPIAVDVTTPELRRLGVHVVKVFVPELLPLTPAQYAPSRHPSLDGVERPTEPHPFP